VTAIDDGAAASDAGETTGLVAFDASGQGRDGTLMGGLDFETDATSGVRGGALAFDGAGFIDAGLLDASGLGTLTVAAWVRPATSAGNQRVVAKDRLGTPGAFLLRWQAQWQAWVFQVYDVAAGTWRNARFDGSSLHDGDWHHLAGTVDAGSGEVRLWVNGVAVDTRPFSAAALNDGDGERLVIGADAQDAFPADPTEWQDSDFERIGKTTCLFPTCLKHAQRFSNGQRRVPPIHGDRHGKNLTQHWVGFLQACEPIRKVGIHWPRGIFHGGNGQPRADEMAYCSGVGRHTGGAR